MWVSGGQYATWAAFLEAWSAGGTPDPAGLPALGEQDFNGDGWERFARRIAEALSRRLQAWADVLSRELSGARDEYAAARAMHDARVRLGTIRAVAGHPGLPEALRDRLTGLVGDQLRSLQADIEKQVWDLQRTGTPRSAVEARLRTVRDNSLLAVLSPGAAGAWAMPATRRGRRVVTD